MLETELIPEIHRRYRTENDLTFAGHSLGGLMALYDLIGGNRLFNRYIALDASWWYDNRLLERQLAKTNHLGDKPMHLFMVLASSPDPSHANTATSFEKTLKAKKFGNLRYTLQKLPTETHNSIDLQGYYHGLKWVFEGYNSPPEKE
jgi:predicted alpha/beta superfamily hydrolase